MFINIKKKEFFFSMLDLGKENIFYIKDKLFILWMSSFFKNLIGFKVRRWLKRNVFGFFSVRIIYFNWKIKI